VAQAPLQALPLAVWKLERPPNELFFPPSHPPRDLVLTIQSSTTSRQHISSIKRQLTRFDSDQSFDKISQDGKPISTLMPGRSVMQSVDGKTVRPTTKNPYKTI
jgi:hypothetical protein